MSRFGIRLFCGFCKVAIVFGGWVYFGVGCGDLMRGMRGFDALLRLTHPTLDLGFGVWDWGLSFHGGDGFWDGGG